MLASRFARIEREYLGGKYRRPLLEHARILYFYHGGDETVFISSADWMPRNLDRRVELLVPVEDLACRRRLLETLDTYFRDNQNAWRLKSDDTYERIQPSNSQAKVRAQRVLFQNAVEAVQQAEQARRNTFEPTRHRRIKRIGTRT